MIYKTAFILFLLIFSCENADENSYLKPTIKALNNVLNFLDNFYDKLNFDALFGMTLAQGKKIF